MDIAIVVATALGGAVVVQAVVIRDLAREVRELSRRQAPPPAPLDVDPPESEPEPQTIVRRRVGFQIERREKDHAQIANLR